MNCGIGVTRGEVHVLGAICCFSPDVRLTFSPACFSFVSEKITLSSPVFSLPNARTLVAGYTRDGRLAFLLYLKNLLWLSQEASAISNQPPSICEYTASTRAHTHPNRDARAHKHTYIHRGLQIILRFLTMQKHSHMPLNTYTHKY